MPGQQTNQTSESLFCASWNPLLPSKKACVDRDNAAPGLLPPKNSAYNIYIYVDILRIYIYTCVRVCRKVVLGFRCLCNPSLLFYAHFLEIIKTLPSTNAFVECVNSDSVY